MQLLNFRTNNTQNTKKLISGIFDFAFLKMSQKLLNSIPEEFDISLKQKHKKSLYKRWELIFKITYTSERGNQEAHIRLRGKECNI